MPPHLAPARTEPTAPRHKGLSVFVFPLATPGVTVRPLYTMEGIRTNEVFLDQVRIPADAMIGAPDTGFYTVAVALDFERVFIGKYTKIRRNFDALVRCCKEPGDNGASLFDDPVVRTSWCGCTSTSRGCACCAPGPPG
jgi:alkylation response protein AidB-like acyl-CoA dehydrogenase